MDCPNCSESFRLRSDYATHLRGCMPRMTVAVSSGSLLTAVRREDREFDGHFDKYRTRREEPAASR